MKKCIVTGSLGLVGREAVNLFADKFDVVIGIDNEQRKKFFDTDTVSSKTPENYIHCNADIREDLSEHFSKDVKLIIHAAGQPSHDWATNHIIEDFAINTVGTLNLLEQTRINVPDAVFIFTSCYDEKTRAYTKEGFKHYSELKEGDIVLSLNQKTGGAEEKKIKSIIIQDYCGGMVKIKNKRTDILVTPNHRMYVNKATSFYGFNSDISVMRADELRHNEYGEYHTVAKLPLSNGYVGITDKIKGFESNMQDLFYLLGAFIGDGSLQRQVKKVRNVTGYKREEYLIKCRNEKGHFISTKERGPEAYSFNTSSVIFFHVPEKDRAREKIEKCLLRIGLTPKIAQSKIAGNWGIFVSNPELFEIFTTCGRSAHSKKIPEWALEYDKSLLDYMFDGLMDTDGSKRGDHYSTVSEQLASDFIGLCGRLGKKANLNNKESLGSKLKCGREIKGGKSFSIRISSSPVVIKNEHISIEQYSGKIWCVGVEDNQNLLVERNGFTYYCGNTNKVYGDYPNDLRYKDCHKRFEPIFTNTFDEITPIDNLKHSFFGCSKLAADLYCQEYGKYLGLKTGVFRCGCITGPNHAGAELHGFLSYLIKCAKNNALYTIYGYGGKQVRDIIHAYDLVTAFNEFYNDPKHGEVYNMGGGTHSNCSVLEAIEICEEITGKKMIIKHGQERIGDHKYWVSDVSKFKNDYPEWGYKYSLQEIFNEMFKHESIRL